MAIKLRNGKCECRRCQSSRTPATPLLFISAPENETLAEFQRRSFVNILAAIGLAIVLGGFALLVVWAVTI